MSLEETSLDDWTTHEDTQDRPRLEYDDDGVRRCQNCDSRVTEQYARVFAREDGTVRECPHCPVDDSTAADRANGSVAGLDPQLRGVSKRRGDR